MKRGVDVLCQFVGEGSDGGFKGEGGYPGGDHIQKIMQFALPVLLQAHLL